MAYDHHLADRIRVVLGPGADVTERKMFGGIAFLVKGHMCVGIVGDDLMVRVGKEAFASAVRAPHARPMDFTGRPSTGMVYVAPAGLRTAPALRAWVRRGLALVATLPSRSGSAKAVRGVVAKGSRREAVRSTARAGAKRAAKTSRARSPGAKASVRRPATASALDAPDPRVDRLLRALRADRLGPVAEEYAARARTAGSGRKFGSNGLKAGGKLFALFTQGTLVVKLPRERVQELTTAKVGVPFDPGHGRLMKEWLTVRSPKAAWLGLVREAHDFVARP